MSNALCRMVEPAPPLNESIVVDGIQIVPSDLPSNITVGDMVPVTLTLTNTTSAPASLTISHQVAVPWETVESNFETLTEVTLGPSELEVEVHLAAVEGGVPKKGLLLPVEVELPDVSVDKQLAMGSVLVFDGSEVDLAVLGTRTDLKVRVTNTFAYV